MKDKYVVVNIRQSLELEKEEKVKKIIQEFSCPQNKEVETFLKKNAIEFTKKRQSITYLVIDNVTGKFVGYFTLAIKPINVLSDNISKTFAKKISRISSYDEETKTYSCAAYLIAQLGKNYSIPYENRITGDELLELIEEQISETQNAIGGIVEFLECEDNKFLIDFYERHNFVYFSKRNTTLQLFLIKDAAQGTFNV